MTLASEQLPDPLLDPLLALLKDAVNTELAEQFEAAGIEAEDVIASTLRRPVNAGDVVVAPASDSLPVLVGFRMREQPFRRTFGHLDYRTTLRLQYIGNACAIDQLNKRWPILSATWRAAFDALCAGHHEAHADDDRVLDAAGVVWLNEAPFKTEGYLPGGDAVYPIWEADVVLDWRDLDKEAGRTRDLYPVLSLDARITQQLEDDGREPAGDVVFTAYTPAGLQELDAEPYEEEAVLA